jgi:nuclear pore complex protein Nup188
MLAKVAMDCLVSNTRNQLSEEIFKKLTQTRADFSLVLAQRLIEANSNVLEMKSLLATVWEAIRTIRGTFERVLDTTDMPYYRSLLKILFLALRVHMDSSIQASGSNDATNGSLASPNIPIVLDVLKYVVANGIREVTATIHEQPAESSPEDIALITGILQACLHIPGIELCHSQIVSTMVSSDAARVATTLFSWSDNLAISGDPIYGELSILFLLELSIMPLMAEQLAIDGVLGHIAAANITSYLRRGNVSPFAEGAGLQRCYNIWVRGVLPLLLNLLDAVQASIAAEVAIFLNQFPTLLQQSIQFIEAPDASRGISKVQTKFITLSICSELHSLSLLVFILNGFRENLAGVAEIPEVKWDAASVVENVEFWLGSRAVLREKILPMGIRDVELARKKVEQSNVGSFKAVTKLEEKVVGELVGIRDVLSGDA